MNKTELKKRIKVVESTIADDVFSLTMGQRFLFRSTVNQIKDQLDNGVNAVINTTVRLLLSYTKDSMRIEIDKDYREKYQILADACQFILTGSVEYNS